MRRRLQCGMTLAELSIGLAIATMAFGTLFALLVHVQRTQYHARCERAATLIAESALERVRAGRETGPYLMTAEQFPMLVGWPGASGLVFCVAVPGHEGHLQQVRAGVSWPDRAGRRRDVALVTIMPVGSP